MRVRGEGEGTTKACKRQPVGHSGYRLLKKADQRVLRTVQPIESWPVVVW